MGRRRVAAGRVHQTRHAQARRHGRGHRQPGSRCLLPPSAHARDHASVGRVELERYVWLVAEILELQWYIGIALAQQCHGRLQIIAFLAADTQLVAVDLRLDLELRGLQLCNELLGSHLLDALLDGDLATRFGQIDLDIPQLQAAQIDAACRQAQPQDVQQLLELEFVLRELADDRAFQLETRSAATQVVALVQLAARLIHGIGELVHIDLGHCIERGHGTETAMRATARLAVSVIGCKIARLGRGNTMRSTVFAATFGTLAATAVLALAQAQAATARTAGPGLKSQEDSRGPALIATCRKNHPATTNFAAPPGGRRRAQRPPAPSYKPPSKVEAIAGVIAGNAHWRHVWSETGNNADGIVGLPDGSVLVAQQDSSDVMSIDPKGHAHIAYQDTNTGGAVSVNKKGEVFIAERGLHEGIWELAPQHKILAISYEGDPIDCLGNFGLNDLTAAANGGVYFTVGGLYYAAPDGTVTKQGNVGGTNGVILSPDEKTLYVTSAKGFGMPGTLVAFDVQPNGQLSNERVVAQLTGGGDG